MVWSQSIFWCVVRWPMRASKPFQACEINAECVSSHYCRAVWIREACTRILCFPRPFAIAVSRGLCCPSVTLQVVCRMWLVCFHTALLPVKAGCTRVLDLTCLSITAVSDTKVDTDCDFSFSVLQGALSLFIASLPAALAIQVGDVLAAFQSCQKRVMIRCSQLKKISICFTGTFVLYAWAEDGISQHQGRTVSQGK